MELPLTKFLHRLYVPSYAISDSVSRAHHQMEYHRRQTTVTNLCLMLFFADAAIVV